MSFALDAERPERKHDQTSPSARASTGKELRAFAQPTRITPGGVTSE